MNCLPYDAKKNAAMLALGEVLMAEAKADPTIGTRGLANWMGLASRLYDALHASTDIGGSEHGQS